VGVTVLDVIKRSTEFLAKKGVESPRLQVELMLAHLLSLPRMGLYLNFERELPPAQLDQLREMVRRRGQREPLQHILGSTSFCGLEMVVNANALIPRPETELLAESGWEFLTTVSPTPPAALDFGTGSGCLAITMAVKSPLAQVHAVDISGEALELARQNAGHHNVADRVQFHLGDGFGALPGGMQFDLIVANPPYIPSAEIETLDPEVRDHDPKQALDGGADGLDFYRRLAGEAGAWLKGGGKIMLEFGDGQADSVRNLFEQQKWIVEQIKADYSGRLRILIARRAD
jgi:release factor glutamine methyltransferase